MLNRIISFLLLTSITYCESTTLETATGTLFGTLEIPKRSIHVPIVLIVSGSGPTDRNGNSIYTKNDCLKQLAISLRDQGIASLRYDKRGVGESRDAGLDEDKLRFEDYILDVREWIHKLNLDKRFLKIFLMGHSEGGLASILAAQKEKVDGLILIATSSANFSQTLLIQLKKNLSTSLFLESKSIISSLEKNEMVEIVSDKLLELFRPSVQPYLISIIKYDPLLEFGKVQVPSLIIQGGRDIQVSKNNARMLVSANDLSKSVVIEIMNHVLKNVDNTPEAQINSYNDPSLKIDDHLKMAIVDFVRKFD